MPQGLVWETCSEPTVLSQGVEERRGLVQASLQDLLRSEAEREGMEDAFQTTAWKLGQGLHRHMKEGRR